MEPAILKALSSNRLQLILHPTERCNLRCTYCYERFEIGRMPPEVVEAVQKLIAGRTDLDELHISWFGGEPLVALDRIRTIGQAAKAHCLSQGIALSGDMTTNGIGLTADVATELVDLGVNFFQISIDGDAECHDRTRIKANGTGTFDEIWANLVDVMATDLDLEIMLRIHYHNDNIDSIDRLIERLATTFDGETRLQLYFKNVSPLGGENDADFPFVERHKREAVVQRFTDRVAGRLPVEKLKDGYICYACKPNSLVIRANGTISKCTVALYDDRNIIGRLNPDGGLEIDQEKLRPWVDALLAGTASDRSCPVGRVLSAAPAEPETAEA